MVMVLAAVVVTGCSTRHNAVKGIADLRSHDFTRDGVVYLAGDWDFVFGSFLTARDFDTHPGVEHVNITDRWRGLRYAGRVLDGKGYCTYRLRVILPTECASFGLRFPRMSSSAVYVGDSLIGEAGRVSAKRTEARPAYKPLLMPLPPLHDTLTLVIRSSNYEYWTGVIQPPEFGPITALRSKQNTAFAIDVATLTGLFCFGVCLLVFFMFRRKDKVMLSLVLLCAACIVRIIAHGEQLLTHVVHDVAWSTLVRCELGGMYLMTLCWSMIGFFLFRQVYHRWIIGTIAGIYIAALMLTVATPVVIHSEIVTPMKVMMMITAAYVLWRTIVALKRRMEGSYTFLIAFVVNVAAAVLEMLYHGGVLLFYIPAPISACLTVCMLLLLLGRRYAISYGRMESFADELEQKVVERTHELRAAQDTIVHQEKMAALGQLTAGIAHEIKNPLNFVNNFAVVSTEILDDIPEDVRAREDVAPVLHDLRDNLARIHEHGTRADAIVRSMMLHARGGSGERRSVDIRALLDETADLAWHGARARMPDFHVTIIRMYAPQVPHITVSPQDISRVFMNLIGNAIDAVRSRALQNGNGYVPRITLTLDQLDAEVEIRVADNGYGVPVDAREKLFTPFFTTKPAGQGTGLGLSISHDIVVKGHGGSMDLDRHEGEGATFVVRLPL